jgi:lysosomal alpha-mannosidase
LNTDYQINIGSQQSQIRDGVSYLEDVTLDNGKISITIDKETGLLKEVELKNGKKVPLTQNFWYYQGEDRFRGEKPSGAYAFNPTHHVPHGSTNAASFKIIRGDLVDEVHQTFKPWITQVIRLYRDYDYIEFDWVIGPIPTKNYLYDHGLEIITRYDTNFQNNGTFFTDSNGRETIRRIRHYRSTWDLETTESVASNYYPVTSWIFLRDYSQDLQMTVLTDRSEGGSSMSDGSLELMLHRRLLFDDGYGVEEALNEPGIQLYIYIELNQLKLFVLKVVIIMD